MKVLSTFLIFIASTASAIGFDAKDMDVKITYYWTVKEVPEVDSTDTSDWVDVKSSDPFSGILPPTIYWVYAIVCHWCVWSK